MLEEQKQAGEIVSDELKKSQQVDYKAEIETRLNNIAEISPLSEMLGLINAWFAADPAGLFGAADKICKNITNIIYPSNNGPLNPISNLSLDRRNYYRKIRLSLRRFSDEQFNVDGFLEDDKLFTQTDGELKFNGQQAWQEYMPQILNDHIIKPNHVAAFLERRKLDCENNEYAEYIPFKEYERRGWVYGAAIGAHLVSAKTSPFFGGRFFLKEVGWDLGCIIEMPSEDKQKQRWFVKHMSDDNLSYYHYISQALLLLGSKYPEFRLIDIGGLCVFASLDMTRTYKKDEVIKNKTFATFASLFPEKGKGKDKEDQKVFLEEFAQSDSARISFAKWIVLKTIFNLVDVHAENMGKLMSEKKQSGQLEGKNHIKIAFIDFRYFKNPIQRRFKLDDFSDFYGILKYSTDSFLLALLEKVTEEDILKAIGQVIAPRSRRWRGPYFLTCSDSSPKTFKSVLEQAFAKAVKAHPKHTEQILEIHNAALEKFKIFKALYDREQPKREAEEVFTRTCHSLTFP